MNLIGKKVRHNKFGEGTIIEQDSSCISVKFVTEDNPKKFMYPSCFKTFLKLLDADAAVQANTTVKRHEEQERKKKQQDAREAEARRFIRKMQKSATCWQQRSGHGGS